MNLSNIFATLVRRKYVVGVVLVLALLASPLAAKFLHVSYVGNASVLLVNDGPGRALVPVDDLPVLITSPAVLNPVRSRFKLDSTIDEMRQRITAKVSLRSSVVPIQYRDHDKRLAQEIPNAIADSSVAYYKQLAGLQFDQLEGYLRKTAEQERQAATVLDAQLQQASAANPLAGSSNPLDRISTQLSDLSAQRATAYAQFVADQAIANAQARQPAEVAGLVRNETLTNDPFVQSMRANVSKDAAQLAFDKAQYTSAYPGLPGLEEQVGAEKTALSAAERAALGRGPSSPVYAQTVLQQRQSAATVAGDRARVAALDAQLAQQRQAIGSLPTSGVSTDALRIKLDSARAAYQALSARLSQTSADQAEATSLAALVVIDRATDAAPRIPAPVLAVLAALAILILAFGAAFLWDALDSGLRSADDIERLYERPLIGTLGSR